MQNNEPIVGKNQINIDEQQAKSIVRKFLEQYHSLIIFKDVILKDDIWTVTADVGQRNNHIVSIQVGAFTGRILACR
jgi:hypothetical protein